MGDSIDNLKLEATNYMTNSISTPNILSANQNNNINNNIKATY
jgi:hypothetical protein